MEIYAVYSTNAEGGEKEQNLPHPPKKPQDPQKNETHSHQVSCRVSFINHQLCTIPESQCIGSEDEEENSSHACSIHYAFLNSNILGIL